jgi:hypothetical protein
VGLGMRFIYIGEDNAVTCARIDRIEELRALRKERQAARSRLVRLLRAEGMPPTDRATGSILSAMAQAGMFRSGGTLVGTNAFRLYEGELGIRLPLGGVANTGEIDIAPFQELSVALEDRVGPGLTETFSALNRIAWPAERGFQCLCRCAARIARPRCCSDFDTQYRSRTGRARSRLVNSGCFPVSRREAAIFVSAVQEKIAAIRPRQIVAPV